MKKLKFNSLLFSIALLISLVATATNAQEGSALRSESGEWVCTSRDSDGIAPYAFAIEQDTFEVDIYDDAVFSTMRECEAALSEPIEAADGEQFFCASRDADGISPYDIFLWNVEESFFGGSTFVDFDQLGLITGSIRECENSLENVTIRNDRAFACASRDNDGISPFSLFALIENPDSVGQVYDSLNNCIGSLPGASNAVQAADALEKIKEATVQASQEESDDPVTARSESGEWVCTSRDSDGIAPYAFAMELDTFELDVSDAVFDTMRECEAALSEPIEAADGEQFFCASRDADGISPFDVFRWNVESSFLGGSTFVDFDQLGLITNTIRECENSLENVTIRSGRAFICASRDNDGISPYSVFPISENPDPVGRVHDSLEVCIDSLK